MLELSLGEYLERVASREPAPGGGVVAGLTVAAAAGLVAMAGRRSPDLDVAADVATEADRLRVRAGQLAEQDGEAYAAVLATADPDLRRQALVTATEVPLTIVLCASEVAALADRVAHEGNPALRGDAVTALLLADAAARSAAHLVRLNSEAADLGPQRTEQARAWCAATAEHAAGWGT